MADNVELGSASGGAIVAADDVGSVFYQQIKLDAGGDGVAVPIIAGRNSDAESLPVALSDEDVALIDGLETAIASTNTKLDTVIAALSTIDGRVDGLETLIGTTNTTLTTIDGRVDGLETLITSTNTKLDTENTNSGAIKTAVETLDNTVGGSELQVDIVGALPAGANAIGKLAANSGVDIGDVDVTTLPAITLAAAQTLATVTTVSTVTSVTAIANALPAGNNNIGDVDVASIAAGDNNIGNVDLASSIPAGTNNIGDVDVLTLPMSIQGPGNPTIDSYTSVLISAAANTADQQLIAAPGSNKQLWVYSWGGSADTADGSIALQDEDNATHTGVMEVTRRGGFAIGASGNFAMPLFKVATNKKLEIDTVTCGFKGWISYAIVSV